MHGMRTVILLVVLLALLLTACGAQPNDLNMEATGTGVPEEATLVPSPEVTASPSGDAASTEAATPIIPVTGDLNPARLSNLMNFEVLNQAGEQLGEVHDIILDLDASGISYVVVSTGGFLNVGEKRVAVPWSVLQVQANADGSAQGFFTLTVDQNLFLNAPEVNLVDALPEMGEAAGEWDKEIRAYWGVNSELTQGSSAVTLPPGTSGLPGTLQPTPEGMPLRGVILASEALGFDFKLQGQEDLNVSIDDMIINIQSGKILYMVIHTNFENAREQWVPIPYSLLQWDLPDRAYILNVDMVTLQSAPFYIDSLYPDTTRPGWDDTYVYFWKDYGLTSRP